MSSVPNSKILSKQNKADSKKGRTNNRNLLELIKILHEIFPKGETINPFYKLELEDYPTEYQHYFRLLTHYITLINQKYRAMEKQRFVISREDITASLNLLEINTLSQYRSTKQQSEELFEILKQNTKEGQILSSRNISEIIQYKKSQTQRFIVMLLEMNKLERVKDSNKNIGYLYRLIQTEEPKTQQNSPQKAENQATKRDPIAEEIAQEFMDNQHYYKEL
jgi:predicted transcriptional regulator